MNTEQKIAALRARWNEIHKDKPTATSPEKPKQPRTPKLVETKDKMPDALAGEEMLNTYLNFRKLLREISNINKPPGVVNDSSNLRLIKEPITWVGNIAVGEDARLPGWWGVVPPKGIMLSFFGLDAKQKALEMAEGLKDL